ncbi:MAG TPA: NifU family protein [Acidimicrobiales bacterium]|jgi:Fe-S cluster biogenesis protein NfuA|nr:NifU family protein [Acidimicrobiales bacterium]
MPEPQNLRATGDRIEQALEELHSTADPRTINLAEELLRLVSELYGAGFARAVELAQEHAPGLIAAFVEDELVASLLLVQGLHPDSLENRVEAALVAVRPFLAQHGGDVELLGIDDELGAVRLRLLGSCDGCPSSASTLAGAVEVAIIDAAPEVTRIVVDEPTKPAVTPVSVPVSLSTKAMYEACPVEVSGG